MSEIETSSESPLVLLSRAVASEVDEALSIYYQVVDLLVDYIAGEGDKAALREMQNGALTLAISLSDLGRTLDDLDAEGIDWIGGDDPRMIRPLVRSLADSMTLLLAIRSQSDCSHINILDRDEIEAWRQSDDLAEWTEKFSL